MKKILFICFAIAFLSSCLPPDLDGSTHYTIKNQSGKTVELSMKNFMKESVRMDTTFLLTNGNKMEMEYYITAPFAVYPFGGRVDSLYVIFDKKDTVLYLRKTESDRNPLLLENYKGGQVGEKHNIFLYEYEYEITEQDYLNAINDKQK